MVHVSDAGGRHKMLAFTTQPEPTFTAIDSIIKVSTKEVVTFNDSSPSSTTSNHSSEPTPTSDFHHSGLIGIHHIHHHHNHSSTTPTKTTTKSPTVPKTILKNTLNSFDESPKYRLSDKMFAEDEHGNNNAGSNGNANYLADAINSNSTNTNTNANSSTTTVRGGSNVAYDNHDLQLISHGLTDSVCETIKLLESDFDTKCATGTTATSAASLSSGISGSSSSTSAGGIDEPNVVYTEEIVISTVPVRSGHSAMTGMTKPGIMKTFSSFSSSSSSSSSGGYSAARKSVSDQWRNPLLYEEDEEAMSQSNESEETPLLTGEETQPSPLSTNDTFRESSGVTGTGTGSSAPPVLHKLGKMTNGTKATGLKRVSFGSSKGSMVETLIYESPVSDEPGKGGKAGTLPISNGMAKSGSRSDSHDSPDSVASGGSTGGSRPPSRVRVTFFESEKPLAVSSPESDILDFDLSKMTLHGSPTVVDHSSPTYNRQISVEGWDNPFRPDGDLSKEADQIVELIKEGKPINDETLRSKSPSVNETMHMSSVPNQNQLNASPKGKEVNGSATNGTNGPVDIQHTTVAPAAQAGQVEHVVLKKKKGCCVIQ